MFARSPRLVFEAALFLLALGIGAVALGPADETVANALYFGAWCAALLLIFSLGLRLPLYLRGRLARVASPAIVTAALALTLVGNIALYRHDAHLDVTFSGRFSAPPELETIARSLQHDVVLTYFYNNKDDDAYAAKQVLSVLGRQQPRLKVRVLDLDTELTAARDYSEKLYNTVVVEAKGRRTQIENTVDLRQMAYAIERVLQQRTQTVCFITGHGEHYAPGHVHYSHVETLSGDRPGRSDVLEAPPDGLDRLKLAIETIGYSDRAIQPATLPKIPEDCAVVADFGATSAYAPAEVQVLRDYLLHGGHALLAYDPRFPVMPELASLLNEVGLSEAGGILSLPAERIARVEFYAGELPSLFNRDPREVWLFNGAPTGPAVANHIETAARLLTVSAPRRVLAAGEYSPGQLAEYGLGPPRFVLAVAETGGNTKRLGFGEATPAQNAQYVQIIGRPELYLLPRDVGEEWQLARDMAGRADSLLLPVSIAQVWATEILSRGTLYRFERDPAGLWFHHVGQHVHTPGGLVHHADPTLAPLIEAELAVLDRLPIARIVARHPDAAALANSGLEHPATILLLYSRDSAGPVARVELGKSAAEGPDCYARIQQSDMLVIVPDDAARHLATLLLLAGTSS